MSHSSRHFVFIDYLRGIAILSVFLWHCLYPAYGMSTLPWQWLHRGFNAPGSFIALLPVHLGFLGVPMFFVISGFCIHLSFNQQGQEWVSFFTRRFFRIYPAYLVVLLLFLLFYSHDVHGFWFQFTYHALLIHNFNQETHFAISGVFWTIAVEVQLYWIYPVLVWLVGKFGWKGTLAGLAACEVFLDVWDDALYQISAFSGYVSPFLLLQVSPVVHCLKGSPLGFWFSWSLGAYAADAYLQRRQLPLAKTSIAFWGFLVVVSYFTILLSPVFFLLCALLTTKIIGKCLAPASALPGTPNVWLRFLRRVGLYSYSIYLLHAPLLDTFARLMHQACPHIWPFPAFLLCAGFWFVVMPLSGLCYRFIEQPGIALGKQFIQKFARDKKALPAGFPAAISTDDKGEG